jgi:hypothetical protein
MTTIGALFKDLHPRMQQPPLVHYMLILPEVDARAYGRCPLISPHRQFAGGRNHRSTRAGVALPPGPLTSEAGQVGLVFSSGLQAYCKTLMPKKIRCEAANVFWVDTSGWHWRAEKQQTTQRAQTAVRVLHCLKATGTRMRL